MKRKPVKPLLRMLFSALNAAHLRSYETYQPVLVAGRRTGGTRSCEIRWEAIEKVLRASEANSLVDLGCSEGYYVVKAAQQGLSFCLGVDFDQRRIFTCYNQVVLNDLQNAGFLMSAVDRKLLEFMPAFDAVIFLSVLHHIMYQHGVEHCRSLLGLLAAKTNKVMFFEMGQSDEHKESWAKDMPDMGSDPHAWIEEFLLSSGFSRAEKITLASSYAGEVDRAVFAVYP